MIGAANGSPVSITGLGTHVPERVVTNDDLARLVDTSDEWIVTRTGIRERRFAAENEALSEGDPEDTASMIAALEGWEFDAPKGPQTIRASDHAMLQPMFTATLTGASGSRTGEVLDTLEADAVAPPEQ